ncbi:MAG TPA: cation:proton antiporter [Candidatus Saccharibacteria bacterium]|nr:cation:proton antiporter [Candidatus Saccharibacteria bacterium]
MHNNIFVEISALLVLSAVISLIVKALRQPLIIGYILTGLIVGPSLLSIVKSPDTIGVLGTFGVTLLLFIVGLGLNPKVIKEVGKVSLFTGLGQVIITSLIGYFIVIALGYSKIEAVYISVALAFSSTIIILKLLNDKREQNKLHGKISIGFLLVQDIIAAIALVIASASGNGSLGYGGALELAAKGILLAVFVFAFSRYCLRPMSSFLSKSQELLFLLSIAWGFGIATLFYEIGFSLEIGALIAGVSLASMNYAQEVGTRLRPLRDFFLVIFFIALGSNINLDTIGQIIPQAILLSLFVLIGNPLIVMTIMGVLGYTKKTGFKSGLAVAQISEFSLIFILLGQSNGQVSDTTVALVTVVGLSTIAVSSYMITYSDGLYRNLERYLKIFERKKVKKELERHHRYEAVLFGYKHGGSEFVNVFEKIAKKYIVVDYDPEAIERMEKQNIPYVYGDATDPEMFDEINLEHAKIVVSVISDYRTNLGLLEMLEKINPSAVMICHAENIHEAVDLYGLGASYVVMPHLVGNQKISLFLRKNGFNKAEFRKFKNGHLSYLQSHFEETLE